MRARIHLTLCIIVFMISLAVLSSNPDVRRGVINDSDAWRDPHFACLTGHDRLGRCVLDTLGGGIHAFLGPGLLAVGICLVGGVILGLSAGYGSRSTKALARAVMNAIESLPRLGVLLIVYYLYGHNAEYVGIALGLTLMPGLAGEIESAIERLGQTEYIRSIRAHGLSESRVVLVHCLWLSCRSIILRQALHAFAQMIMVDMTLSYALQMNMAQDELSWGYLLLSQVATLSESMWALADLITGHPTTINWARGWPQFSSVVLFVVFSLWSIESVRGWATLQWERDR